jgi:hypothetical protein
MMKLPHCQSNNEIGERIISVMYEVLIVVTEECCLLGYDAMWLL